MDFIQANLIDPVNKALYTYILVYLLVAVGIYFTIRTRFVQFRYFPRMLKQLVHSRSHDPGISPFQAFCVGLASRVGTGNIAGVAIALTVGGPGAIFWMWVVALIGMATALIEATLGQIFKVRAGDGTFRGGPAFYIQRGLGSRAGGVVFALLLVFAFGFAFNMVQANAIADVLNASYEVEVQYTTIGLVLLAAPVLFGGVRRVARVAEIVLPLMALAYVALALVIIALHINYLPEMFKQIIGGAFGLTEMAGGFTGGIAAAMLNGVKRGLFSNEAGMGSVPNVAATATVSHPVKQGLIQSLGVFVDTILICSATAFIILVSGPEIYDPSQPTKMAGASLTAAAVASALGAWTTWLMTVLVFVFAFSSVLGNYVYAEINLFYLGVRNGFITGFRMAVLAGIAIGGLAALEAVWDLADVAMGLMAIVNLTAIVLLGRWALAALRDFARQADQGRDPVFIAEDAGLPGHLDGDIWNRQTAPEREVSA
ncbi:MAG: alanine:cation symporter family protein [Mycobacterium sp.]|nr:alanine:cation symporter family protein [Mycobacterium sp.]